MSSAEDNLSEQRPQAEELFYIYPAGLMSGRVLSQETIRKAMEAEERYQEKKREKNKRPPKPPSRPNAKIGGIALGNT